MSRDTVIGLTRFYGVIGILCVTVGVVLNCLVFKFFYNKRSTLSNMLYSIIVVVDVLVSILTLFYLIPHFSEFRNRNPQVFNEVFCKVWSVLWRVASKLTVSLVMLLGVFRTAKILFPLNVVVMGLKRRAALIYIGITVVVLVVAETVPMWWSYTWRFDELRMRCDWRAADECDERCHDVRTFQYVWNTVTLAIPVLPMLVSAVLSVYALNRADRAQVPASMTIVWFTLLYVALNIPTLVYWVLMLIHMESGYTSRVLKFDQPYYFFSNLVEVLTVSLNSALNPLLYLIRMQHLRKFLADIPSSVVSSGSAKFPQFLKSTTDTNSRGSKPSTSGFNNSSV